VYLADWKYRGGGICKSGIRSGPRRHGPVRRHFCDETTLRSATTLILPNTKDTDVVKLVPGTPCKVKLIALIAGPRTSCECMPEPAVP
jgi:hypothetical protein